MRLLQTLSTLGNSPAQQLLPKAMMHCSTINKFRFLGHRLDSSQSMNIYRGTQNTRTITTHGTQKRSCAVESTILACYCRRCRLQRPDSLPTWLNTRTTSLLGVRTQMSPRNPSSVLPVAHCAVGSRSFLTNLGREQPTSWN